MKCYSKQLWISNLLFLVALTTAVIGCESDTQRAETRTIEDMTGRKIPIPLKINRVAVLTSPCVQIMYIIGARDKLCAITKPFRTHLLAKIDSNLRSVLAPRDCMTEINIEELLRTNPDICMGSIQDMQTVEGNTKLPTVYLTTISREGITFEKQMEEVRLFGKIMGKEEKAEKYISYLADGLIFLKKRMANIPEKRRVSFGFGPNHQVTLGGDTYLQKRIEAAGCINVAERLSTLGGKEGGLSEVSMEQILAWNPDLVVIDEGTPERVFTNPQWRGITAVKNDKVFRLPIGVFKWNRPSAEASVLFPQWLARIAYPARFQDRSIAAEIKRYFREILEYELDDREIKTILHPEGEDKKGIRYAPKS
ncbi:MAG: ABC transporter substrate-binding protein [Thermodesulfobacteriota bacterium]|nr:ABC transporter substrate-binding protein [Thermodesulfobacteriota bacterium]